MKTTLEIMLEVTSIQAPDTDIQALREKLEQLLKKETSPRAAQG